MTDLAERPAVRTVPDIRVPLPGPKARKHVAFDHQFTSPSLPRAYPLVPVRGNGSTVEDIDGNLLLDFTAGIAVSSTGYAHPRITAALERQARDLIHFSASDFYLPVYAELAAKFDRDLADQGRRLGHSSATPAQKRSRQRSSWHASPPVASTSLHSWAASTAAPTAR